MAATTIHDLRPAEAHELKSFVREGLGCGCPDEVFSKIRVEDPPHVFQGLSVHRLVRIGDRLLLAVYDPDAPGDESGEHMERILTVGKQLRDASGFNRFRLVVTAKEADSIAPRLQEYFAGLAGLDDRIHLHVVSPSAVPHLLL